MKQKVKILTTKHVAHNVKRFIIEKPPDFRCVPGQGTLMALDIDGLRNDFHPFTPTSLNEDCVLEFVIKRYPEHKGLTDKLHDLPPGAEVLLNQVFGDTQYKGPGVFIAGGAGITPFLAILRQLHRDGTLGSDDMLIFSNRTWADVILERELKSYLGDRAVFLLTREERAGYENRELGPEFLGERIKDFDQYFYVCGPPKFMADVNGWLKELGAAEERLIFDEP